MPHRLFCLFVCLFYLFFRVPSALGMALAPPSTVQDDSPSSVWMRCRRFEPEDGRLRFRKHAPQEVIMFKRVASSGCTSRRAWTGSCYACSDRVAGASAKAPDSGERPWSSAARAPGAKQVTCLREQASLVMSRMHRGCRARLWINFRRKRT